MRDVSCTATASALEVLERMGVPAEEVVHGLPVSLERLRSPTKRVDWNVFARFMDNVGERIGPAALERLGGMLFEAPSFKYLGLLAHLVTPRQALQLTDRLLGPMLFPMLHHRLEELPHGRMRLILEVPAELRGSEAFFSIVAGNLRAIPRLYGRPEPSMEARIEARRASFTMAIEPEPLLARLRRAAKLLYQPQSLVHTIVQQREVVQESYEALARFRQDFQTVIERLPDGVAILRGGRVLYANRSIVEALGYEHLDELAGRAVAEFLPPDQQDRLGRVMLQYDGKPPPGEVSLQRRDGRQVAFDVLPVQVIDFEGERANLVVLRDLTDRKRLQQQLMLADRMASLGTLAAGVAHELNNPLAYAHISLHTLDRALTELEATHPHGTPSIEVIREALGAAQHGIDRVRTIVGDLRTFSRPDDETIEPVDVHRVLESAISMAAQELRHRGRLVRDYGHVPRVLANDARIGQVFLNLLVNAAQALPDEGGHDNVIRLRTSTAHDGRVSVEVIDNGPGIPADIVEHVFVPFVTTKPSSVGTGLGLSICHRIVTRLGGQIAVDSSPGAGTTVRVTLPASEASERGRETTPQLPTATRAARILIVDDEPVLLDTLRTLLDGEHVVTTAKSGRRALELLAEDPTFDLILCDLMMDDVTGMEVYETLQSTMPGLEERIVFMTGGAYTNTTRRFLTQVGNPCLDKPFGVEQVLDLVADRLRADSQPQSTPGG
ncbi:MAG: hybrid sensor histidine kinase/response regulator [Myxococcota bacterium]